MTHVPQRPDSAGRRAHQGAGSVTRKASAVPIKTMLMTVGTRGSGRVEGPAAREVQTPRAKRVHPDEKRDPDDSDRDEAEAECTWVRNPEDHQSDDDAEDRVIPPGRDDPLGQTRSISIESGQRFPRRIAIRGPRTRVIFHAGKSSVDFPVRQVT